MDRRALPIVCATVVWCTACGANDSMRGAGRTISTSWQVIAEAERTLRRSEDPDAEVEVITAIRAARLRLGQAEEVVRIWQETDVGRAGWYVITSCLAASLANLGRAMERAELEIPRDLDQAEMMAAEGTTARCAEQRHMESTASLAPEHREPAEEAGPELAGRLGQPPPTR